VDSSFLWERKSEAQVGPVGTRLILLDFFCPYFPAKVGTGRKVGPNENERGTAFQMPSVLPTYPPARASKRAVDRCPNGLFIEPMTQGQEHKLGAINWKAVGAWLIDIVKAFRGGPGRFYAYTFAAGMAALVGAQWWAPILDAAATWAIEYFRGSALEADDKISRVPPLLIALSGLFISLLSIALFHQTVGNGLKNQKSSKTPMRITIPADSKLRDGIACLEEIAERPFDISMLPNDMLDRNIRGGEYEWESIDEALHGLLVLVDAENTRKVILEQNNGRILLRLENHTDVEHLPMP